MQQEQSKPESRLGKAGVSQGFLDIRKGGLPIAISYSISD